GYFGPITGAGVTYAAIDGTATSPMMIEAAFPWSVFTSDPLGMGYPLATSEVQLRLSQSFGYSVAGGSFYGDARLGTYPVPSAVPEASSVFVFGVIGLGLAFAAKSRIGRSLIAGLK